MQPTYEYVVVAVITLVAAAAVFAVWVVNRKRIAAETIGRAEEQALRIIKDAERDAEGHKKEALLDAKEKAHEIVIEAERQSRRELQQNQALEQALVRREAQAAERQSSIERREKELDSRESAVAAREKHADSVQTKLDQLVTRQQRELERVASLTAEEAKELLIKHIEADARHDAANLLKRLDSEAR